MMISSNYRVPAFVLGVTTMLVAPAQVSQALSSKEVSAIAQAVTVRIHGQNPGSGVLIKREGNTYTVLTAAHVVATEDEYEIITPDEQRYPLKYQNVRKFDGVDLALVKFESGKDYAVSKIGNAAEAISGTAIYIAGFPAPTVAITESIFNFTEGKITANASRPLADGYALIYDNKTLTGMSGGAILDHQGKLIGIHGRADAQQQQQQQQQSKTVYLKTGFNLGIPIDTYLSLNRQESITDIAKPQPNQQTDPTADDLYLSGLEALQKQKYQTSIANFDKVIQLKPKFAQAYFARGLARYNIGVKKGASLDFDNKGASKDYNRAIKLKPDYAEAYVGRGITRSNIGDKKAAITDFDKAIQFNPDLAIAYFHRGSTHYDIGDHERAIADYTQAIRIKPDHAPAYFALGSARHKMGDTKEAIIDLKTAASLYNQQGNQKSYELVNYMIRLYSDPY